MHFRATDKVFGLLVAVGEAAKMEIIPEGTGRTSIDFQEFWLSTKLILKKKLLKWHYVRREMMRHYAIIVLRILWTVVFWMRSPALQICWNRMHL